MSAPLVITPPAPGMARLRFVTVRDSPISELIRFDTMTQIASHVEAVLSDGVIGAYPEGVQKKPLDYDTESTKQTFVDIPMAPVMLSAWTTALEWHIGQPYDFLAIAGFATHTDMHEKGAVICSALQTVCLRACDFFPRPLGVPAHEISPRDLLLVLAGRQEPIIHPTETRK